MCSTPQPPPPQQLTTIKTPLFKPSPTVTFPSLTNYSNFKHLSSTTTTTTTTPIFQTISTTQKRLFKNKTTNPSISSLHYKSMSTPKQMTAVLDVAGSSGFTLNERLNWVVSEFKSLTEPVDRVRRLLDYAARLPKMDGSGRVEENRVAGCTTQVWVEAEVEEGSGKVRFRGDSDSEITKGFVSCLIWVLDGAESAEVVAVRAEEMEAVNVNGGGYGKEKSRVNTWLNVLLALQDKTRALAARRKEPGEVPADADADAEALVLVSPLASLVANGSFDVNSQLEVQNPQWKQLDANLFPS